MGRCEYGFGFYASDYAGEFISEYADPRDRVFVYRMEIPDAHFEKTWLLSTNPIGEDRLERITAELTKQGYKDTAEWVEKAGPQATGFEIYTRMNLGTDAASVKKKSAILYAAGIEGYREGSYYVFLNENAVPAFEMEHARNYAGRDAAAELKTLQEIDRKPIVAEDFAATDRTDFRSEMAYAGYHRLKECTKDPALCRQYADLVTMTQDPALSREGFQMRDALGHMVVRALGNRKSDNAYFGSTILRTGNVTDNVSSTYAGDFLEKFSAFISELKKDPRVENYLHHAPKDSDSHRPRPAPSVTTQMQHSI